MTLVMLVTSALMLWWLSITPLGTPVEPLEKSTTAVCSTSFQVTGESSFISSSEFRKSTAMSQMNLRHGVMAVLSSSSRKIIPGRVGNFSFSTKARRVMMCRTFARSIAESTARCCEV